MTPQIPTGLDQEQTTTQTHFPLSYRTYKARHLTPELTATYEAYKHLKSSRSRHVLDRFQTCGTYAFFVRHQLTGEVRVHSNHCCLRWCPLCGQNLANYRTYAVMQWIKTLHRPKFITLTLKHSRAPLHFQIKHLYDCFRKLRRLPLLRRAIRGGIWFFQVKVAASDGLYHPHLHIVCDCDYIPKDQLSRAWAAITHTSRIIDIKALSNPGATAKYVARYSSRPAQLADVNLDRRIQLIVALHGRRICGTWGSGRTVSLKIPRADDAEMWTTVGSWSLITHSYRTSQIARKILSAWIHKTTVEESCTLYAQEQELIYPEFVQKPETYRQSNLSQERSPPCSQILLAFAEP